MPAGIQSRMAVGNGRGAVDGGRVGGYGPGRGRPGSAVAKASKGAAVHKVSPCAPSVLSGGVVLLHVQGEGLRADELQCESRSGGFLVDVVSGPVPSARDCEVLLPIRVFRQSGTPHSACRVAVSYAGARRTCFVDVQHETIASPAKKS